LRFPGGTPQTAEACAQEDRFGVGSKD
jgi:hypothetical protein